MELAKVEIVIQDACILFDLVDLDLLDSFFELGLIVYTTPAVLAEISDEVQLDAISPFLENKLLLDEFGINESIVHIFRSSPGLSFADSTVLEAAIRKQASILSSDSSLRKISEQRKITVRGLLWVIEELVKCEILSVATAIEKLMLYQEINLRAPKKEITNLILKLK